MADEKKPVARMICELSVANNCVKNNPYCFHSVEHDEAIFVGVSYCRKKNLCDNLRTGSVKTVCIDIKK